MYSDLIIIQHISVVTTIVCGASIIILLFVSFFLQYFMKKCEVVSGAHEQMLATINELLELKNKAEQANKAKSNFIANVSHELRTPLNAVLGYSDLILQETSNSNDKNYALAIRKATDNILTIINTILDIAKMEEGKIDIENIEYNTMDLFCEVESIISIPAKAKGLELIIDIDPTIPAMLYGGKDSIRQVLINLLSNGVKFTEQGHVKLTVTGTRVNDELIELTFEIEDSGIGIKKDDLGYIFEKFEQTNYEKISTVEGTGLGLYISKSFIQLMGGSLTVESKYGEGSTFTIHLIQKICSKHTITEIPKLVSKDELNKSKLCLFAPRARILSVDDNPINNSVFYKFCKRFGIEAEMVESGYEAIEQLKKKQYDIVFLDQKMPGIDGVETLNEIQKLDNTNPNMYILAFTANAVSDNREYLLAVGFDDVILKPIGINELESVLNYFLPEQVKDKKSELITVSDSMEDITPIIDTSIGLEHCNYDEDLYRQTLQLVVNYLPNKLKCLKQYQVEKDYKSYVIEVHALKNNASLIGAMMLSDDAKNLELAGIESRYDIIDQSTEVLIQKFEQLLNHIRTSLKMN